MVYMRSVRKMMFAIMVDETTGCSHHEQFAMCIRFCTSQLEINSSFSVRWFLRIREASCSDTAESRSCQLLDVLLRLPFAIKHSRGQCYDGTANVAEHLQGLLQDLESSLSNVLDIQLTLLFKMQSQLFQCFEIVCICL